MAKNNKKLNSQKAFTLIEVVIAMGIFAIVAVGSAGAFANAFKSYKAAKNVNQNLENAQHAMSLMTKTFRTSSIIDNSSTRKLEVCDYSQSQCFQYEFTGGTLTQDTAEPSFDTNGICTCGSFTGSPTKMTMGDVSGFFDSVKSEGDEEEKTSTKVGKVTVMMDITSGGSGMGSSSARLQSTVSLRDYQTSNIGIDPNNDPNN